MTSRQLTQSRNLEMIRRHTQGHFYWIKQVQLMQHDVLTHKQATHLLPLG